MRTIAEIEADLVATKDERSEYRAETGRLTSEVERARADGEQEITSRIVALERERTAVLDAEAVAKPHEWEGQKVERVEIQTHRWSAREISRKTIYGIVETVSSKTVFPANKRWGRPSIGEPIVRLLKKDGSTGTKYEVLNRRGYREDAQWKLSQ